MPVGIKGIKALPPRPQKTRTPEEQKTLEQQTGASMLTQLGLVTAFNNADSKGKGKGGFGALTGTLMALPIIGGLIGTFVGGSSASSASSASTKTDAAATAVNQSTVVAAGIVIFSSSMLLCCCVLLMVLLSSMQ
jgi:hypothetical protein